MREIIFNKNNYNTYKDFYEDIFKELDGDKFVDFDELKNCNYNADILNEFMWYNSRKNIKYIFKNFNIEEINQQQTIDDYEYSMIIGIFKDFANEYSNNEVVFE